MNYNLKRKMKNILKHEIFQKFLGWLISLYIKVCYQSSIWIEKNDEVVLEHLKKKKSFIVCFWHNRLLMAPLCWKYDKTFKMLISSHKDGRIISGAVSHLGIETISGSSRRNKFSSGKEIIKELKNNNAIGISPDGPRGPKEKIKEGLVSLIKKTDASIIPLSYSAKFKISFNSWDNFIFVFPFNKFVAVWGNPINFDKKKNNSENLKILENELKRVTRLSDNLSK